MKTFMFMVALATTGLAACSNPPESSAKTNGYIETQHSAITERLVSAAVTPQNESLNEVITHYLHLKNALASDHSEEAAKAGGQLQTAIASLGKQTMNETQKKVYADISDNVEENADQISGNGGNIKLQRAHFQHLSDDIYVLVKAFGTSQTLYKDYCPMAKASWLSEVKSINNPYFGKNMPGCGIVKETITQ